MIPDPAQALALAQTAFEQCFPDASFAFAGGSIMRGEGTHFSDIDMVVIHDRLPHAHRKSFLFEGVPVEAFVHDPETLAWFVEADSRKGHPAIISVIAGGRIIGADVVSAQALQARMAARLAAGPPPLDAEQRDRLRYGITDMLDDLRGDRSMAEIMALGAALYPRLAELSLRGRGSWNGSGKWVPRMLERAEPGLRDRYETAFAALFTRGASATVIALAEQEMAPHGGPLFDGYRGDAPPFSRIAGSEA
ncbi:nucleotidyltransferase domain-containing protein [Sphingobium nicotianae]|uniref:Nucleotidyltransferase domain-containing protein n=1 Tax=Sphingobium nicotianae TaxID=2782607 RepID=A0A9X1IRL6_9SPHN|nr:nucleotidyltransferase domain-containing protein [Sphingobium nicotianae]MBT2187558.1 nucleotidyltransferase domain-containing protein [Sphingobium nicotianae]